MGIEISDFLPSSLFASCDNVYARMHLSELDVQAFCSEKLKLWRRDWKLENFLFLVGLLPLDPILQALTLCTTFEMFVEEMGGIR